MDFGEMMFEATMRGLNPSDMPKFVRDNMDDEELSSSLLFIVTTLSDHPEMLTKNPWSIPILNVFALIISERLNPGLEELSKNTEDEIRKFRDQLNDFGNGDGLNFPN